MMSQRPLPHQCLSPILCQPPGGKSAVWCVYTGSSAYVCPLQEPLPSLWAPAQTKASRTHFLGTYCVPVPHCSAQARRAPGATSGKAIWEGDTVYCVLHDQEDFTAGLYEAFRKPTERSRWVPKARPGEAPRASPNVPFCPWEELRTWYIANWPAICTSV